MGTLKIEVSLEIPGKTAAYGGDVIAKAELSVPEDVDEHGIRGVAGDVVGSFMTQSASALSWRANKAGIAAKVLQEIVKGSDRSGVVALEGQEAIDFLRQHVSNEAADDFARREAESKARDKRFSRREAQAELAAEIDRVPQGERPAQPDDREAAEAST